MNFLDRIVDFIARRQEDREREREHNNMLDRQDKRRRAQANEYDDQAGVLAQIRREQGL